MPLKSPSDYLSAGLKVNYPGNNTGNVKDASGMILRSSGLPRSHNDVALRISAVSPY